MPSSKMSTTLTNVEIENARKSSSKPARIVRFNDQVLCVQFSPFVWSQDVIFVVLLSKICIGNIKVQSDTIEYETVAEFHNPVRCHSLAISPETTLNALPNVLMFCTAGNDFKLRLYRSDLSEGNVCQVISGHTDYINDISFDPDSNVIASTGDDHTAKLWNPSDCACIVTFYLTSAGVSVCWHKEDTSKLLVAEKNGLIRFYNIQTSQPILSLDCGKVLSKAHWAPSDSQLVGVLQHGELLLWDLTRPSRPVNSKLLHTEAGGDVKFCPAGDLVATVNHLESSLKVTHVSSLQIRLSVETVLPTGLAWHCRLPILCLGDDRKLCFWRLNIN